MDADLRARLQQALTDQYEIERELTGGGMSRVFVARERSLGRQVVIKVLPSDLAASVSIERFRREIQLAAQLQHPHIVPLFTAGEAAGLPYFTMPFVSGESLRLRLASGELPVHDAVRILREVAAALEFAHAHGVVHRDVKPDNVLLSGGSAMVTDFGVAKAVSASTLSDSPSTVTSLGVALGTPAYMAPEQAAADTRVDHRADIYSFGVLAYEMLCGSTPFSGRSASATLAAQVNEAPEALHRRRAAVPPGLAQLVMRCLEKSPADRPQNANQIVTTLDSLSTPSMGMAPATAARGGRRMLYIAGAIAALLIVGAYLSGRFGTASASVGKSIAVLPFVSADTANEYFADGMTDDLASALGKVEGLRVAARSSAYSFKGKNADVKDVGSKLNVGSVLEGTVRKNGSRLKITAELVNARDGLTLWSDSWDREATDVFAVQEEISRSIVNALRLTLSGGTAAKLASHGTTNTQAHELYLRGRFFTNRFTKQDLLNSLALYRQALAVDSNYALAYVGIGDTYVNIADDWMAPTEAYPKAKEAILHAIAIDDASAEAHSALATIHLWYDWDGVSGERELRRAIALNPNYARAFHYLARLHAIRLNTDSAVITMKRAITLDPLAPRNHSILASFYNSANRPDDAIAAARGALAIDPNFGPALFEIGTALMAKGDLTGADDAFTRAVANGSTWARASVVALTARAGKMPEARRSLDAIIAERRAGYVAATVIASAYVGLGERDHAFAWLDSGVTEHTGTAPDIRRNPIFRPIQTDPRWAQLLARVNFK